MLRALGSQPSSSEDEEKEEGRMQREAEEHYGQQRMAERGEPVGGDEEDKAEEVGPAVPWHEDIHGWCELYKWCRSRNLLKTGKKDERTATHFSLCESPLPPWPPPTSPICLLFTFPPPLPHCHLRLQDQAHLRG
jgi:hypothetical protein